MITGAKRVQGASRTAVPPLAARYRVGIRIRAARLRVNLCQEDVA